jgi:WD40 repeat protein
VRKLDYFPNLNTLVSISEVKSKTINSPKDCQIKLWSLKNLTFNSQIQDIEPYLILRGHTGQLYSVAVSPDENNFLYTAGNEVNKIMKRAS